MSGGDGCSDVPCLVDSILRVGGPETVDQEGIVPVVNSISTNVDDNPRKRRREEASFPDGGLTFINPPPPDISCAICSSIFTNPVIVNGCGHEFCEDCIKRAVAIKPECPLCKHQVTPSGFYTPLRRLKDDIGKLMVFCPFYGEGLCQEKLMMGEVQKHIHVCPSAFIKCTNSTFGCTWEGRRREHDAHTSKCVFEMVKPVIAKLMSEIEKVNDANKRLQTDLEVTNRRVRELEAKNNFLQAEVKKSQCYEAVTRASGARKRILHLRKQKPEAPPPEQQPVLNVRVAENNVYQWVFKIKPTTKLGRIREIIQEKRQVPILLTCDGPLNFGGSIVDASDSLHDLGIEVQSGDAITLYAEHL